MNDRDPDRTEAIHQIAAVPAPTTPYLWTSTRLRSISLAPRAVFFFAIKAIAYSLRTTQYFSFWGIYSHRGPNSGPRSRVQIDASPFPRVTFAPLLRRAPINAIRLNDRQDLIQ